MIIKKIIKNKLAMTIFFFFIIHPAIFAQIISMPSTPYSMCVADFNHDTFSDIAVGLDGAIQILWGNMYGEFSTNNATNVLLNGRPDKIIAGDINGDGWVDIIVSDGLKGHIKILLNIEGNFILHDESPSFSSNTIAIGYVNEDEFPDIVVAPPAGGIGVFYGKGNFDMGDSSWFNYQVYSLFSTACKGITLKDIDRDGVSEVFAVAGNELYVLKNTEETFSIISIIQTGSQPSDVKVADFNHDNIYDIVVLNTMSNSCALYFGITDTTFNTSPTIYNLSPRPDEIVIGDFNYDSYLDIAVLSEAGREITFLLDTPSGDLIKSNTTITTGNFPKDLNLTDFDMDGIVDLVYINKEDSSIEIHFSELLEEISPSQETTTSLEDPDISLQILPDTTVEVNATSTIQIQLSISPNSYSGKNGSLKIEITNLDTQETKYITPTALSDSETYFIENWAISEITESTIFSTSSFNLFNKMGTGHYSITATLIFNDNTGSTHYVSDTKQLFLISQPIDYQNPPTLNIYLDTTSNYLNLYANFTVPNPWEGLPADIYLWNECTYTMDNGSQCCVYTQKYTSDRQWDMGVECQDMTQGCPLGIMQPFVTWSISSVDYVELFSFPLSIYPQGTSCYVNIELVIKTWNGLDYTIWKREPFTP